MLWTRVKGEAPTKWKFSRKPTRDEREYSSIHSVAKMMLPGEIAVEISHRHCNHAPLQIPSSLSLNPDLWSQSNELLR